LKTWNVVTENKETLVEADRIALHENGNLVLFLTSTLKDGALSETLVGTAPSHSVVSPI
jgi:hypothetical protein